MVRIFNIFFPVRLVVLLLGELTIICGSFTLAAVIHAGQFPHLVLNPPTPFLRILGLTALSALALYYFDLYDIQLLQSRGEMFFRLLIVLGSITLLLCAICFIRPGLVVDSNIYVLGIALLTVGLLFWRTVFFWLVRWPRLRERVYVLGVGERASRLVEILRTHTELGMEVVGWGGSLANSATGREEFGEQLTALRKKYAINRVIVALPDRRGVMPVRELLDLRLSNVAIEDATGTLEKISGKIDIDALNPSWLIFSDGFRMSRGFRFLRAAIAFSLAFVCLLITLPLFPLIALAIKLSSPGQVFYKQERVGRNGKSFFCRKFRTMRADAEADTGPTWAADDDPRITPVGRFLRRCRLDELPQLWNVLCGEMSFVGPRPERPEFVQWLNDAIPYYHIRHTVRPGITGWAQVNYPYGASLEDAKEKLKYDLYHIKNMSLCFDLLIAFQTIKIVLFGRGAK
jgi:sugar transferase (PEP-CTERM system associated)